MNQTLKRELEANIGKVITGLNILDAAFKNHFEETPADDLEPTVEFMSAWRKIKAVRQTLHTINLGIEV